MAEAEQWCRLLQVSPDADVLTACRAFERLAVALAPHDLADWPVYALPTSALPIEFVAASRHCGGWYHDWSYSGVRPHLLDDRGPGLVLFVNDKCSRDYLLDLARGAQAVLAAQGEHESVDELLKDAMELMGDTQPINFLCGVLTHELAHAIDSTVNGNADLWLSAIAYRPSLIESARRQFDGVLDRRQQQTSPPPPQLDCHGLTFTRIMAHLYFRLRVAGVASTRLDVAGERYGQRSYLDCFAALGDEPATCIDKSFAEILSSPLPAAFETCDLTAG